MEYWGRRICKKSIDHHPVEGQTMRERGRNFSKSETLQTAILCQISTARIFALSLCWLPLLQNGVLKAASIHPSVSLVCYRIRILFLTALSASLAPVSSWVSRGPDIHFGPAASSELGTKPMSSGPVSGFNMSYFVAGCL